MDRIIRASLARLPARVLAAVGTSLALLAALPAAAAEYVVTTTDDTNALGCSQQTCSLREAILAANASGAPSTIRLGSGTYVITIAGSNENEGLLGDFDIAGDVTIVGAGPGATMISTAYLGEQIVDVAAGARVRFENLSMVVGIRTGRFGIGDADSTVLEVSHTTLGSTLPGDTINARGTVLIEDSTLSGGAASNGQAVIRFEGKRLEVARSIINPGSIGIGARMMTDGTFTLVDSTVNASGQRNACGAIDVQNASSISVIRSQSFGAFPAEKPPSCFSGAKIVIRDSAFSTRATGYQALGVYGTAIIRNSTIAGSLTTSGTASLGHVTVGGQVAFAGQGPYAIERISGTVSVSNSLLIGSCTGGGISALGNNVESPGNTCGLPADSSRVSQTFDSLELGPLATNGGPTMNYLPGSTSVLNTVFTADGLARCAATDQRGFLRASACTIGAVESGATEQVLFRDGFDP